MKINKKYWLIGLSILAVAVVGFYTSGYFKAKNDQRTAKIWFVDNKLNDPITGYYEIYAKDESNNKEYVIDVTSVFRNKKFGSGCIKMPEVKAGQSIRFRLPSTTVNKELNLPDNKLFIGCYNLLDPSAPWYGIW